MSKPGRLWPVLETLPLQCQLTWSSTGPAVLHAQAASQLIQEIKATVGVGHEDGSLAGIHKADHDTFKPGVTAVVVELGRSVGSSQAKPEAPATGLMAEHFTDHFARKDRVAAARFGALERDHKLREIRGSRPETRRGQLRIDVPSAGQRLAVDMSFGRDGFKPSGRWLPG